MWYLISWKFAVRSIQDPSRFNISIHITVKGKYQVLNEVVVFSKSHKQDSLENRQTYADVFNYSRPGLSTSIAPGGGVGADLDELINVFRFKRNKRLRAFQQRLEIQEQESYVNYRFNKVYVKRITGLTGEYLDSFMVWYRPGYEFARNSDELVFNQYILNAFYQFQKLVIVPPAKKEDWWINATNTLRQNPAQRTVYYSLFHFTHIWVFITLLPLMLKSKKRAVIFMLKCFVTVK